MKKTLLSILVLLSTLYGFSQTKEFSKINKASLKNSGVLESKDGNNGYYFFYQYDKASKGKLTYILDLVDANFKPIKKINVVRPVKDLLLECTYNGSNFFLVFLNKKYEMEILSYTVDGKRVGTKTTKKLTSYELSLVMQRAKSDLLANNIIPVGKDAIIKLYNPMTNKASKEKFSVECMDNALKPKWKYTSDNKTKMYENPEYLYSSEKYLILSVTRFKSALDNDAAQSILMLDAKNGKKIYEQELNTKKNKKLYINTFFDDETSELVVAGEFYGPKDNTVKDKSLGIFFSKFDSLGHMVKSQELAWGKDFRKFAKMNPNGTNEEKAYTFFHKIIKTEDDKYFIIGEQYKKTVSAMGIATVVLSKGQSGGIMNFNVIDMVLMELDSAFEIQQVKTFDKKKNTVNLPGGYSYLSPPSVSRVMNAMGYFDYLFTTQDKKNDRFYASYYSVEKNAKTKVKEGYVGTIGYDKEIKHDKLVIKSDANSVRIMQGKPGYVAFLEYYKKKKTMKVRLEKINIE